MPLFIVGVGADAAEGRVLVLPPGRLRTLQRRVRQWRAQQRPQKQPRPLEVGKKEQNGDVEALERRLLQHLLMRGGRDFESAGAYESGVQGGAGEGPQAARREGGGSAGVAEAAGRCSGGWVARGTESTTGTPAASTLEAQGVQVLARLLAEGGLRGAEQVKAQVAPARPEVPELAQPEVDPSSDDALRVEQREVAS